jgi:hypothetical protein
MYQFRLLISWHDSQSWESWCRLKHSGRRNRDSLDFFVVLQFPQDSSAFLMFVIIEAKLNLAALHPLLIYGCFLVCSRQGKGKVSGDLRCFVGAARPE